jgi:hypothetical protein
MNEEFYKKNGWWEWLEMLDDVAVGFSELRAEDCQYYNDDNGDEYQD